MGYLKKMWFFKFCKFGFHTALTIRMIDSRIYPWGAKQGQGAGLIVAFVECVVLALVQPLHSLAAQLVIKCH